MGSPMTLQASFQGADVTPEPENHRRATGEVKESPNGQYSGARDHRDAQIGIFKDMPSRAVLEIFSTPVPSPDSETDSVMTSP